MSYPSFHYTATLTFIFYLNIPILFLPEVWKTDLAELSLCKKVSLFQKYIEPILIPLNNTDTKRVSLDVPLEDAHGFYLIVCWDRTISEGTSLPGGVKLHSVNDKRDSGHCSVMVRTNHTRGITAGRETNILYMPHRHILSHCTSLGRYQKITLTFILL